MMNLKNFNLKDLKDVAKQVNIKGFSTMKKDALVDALAAEMEGNEEVTGIVEARLTELDGERPVKNTVHPSLGITELTYNGKTQSITKWAEEVGLNRPALYDRINRHGWSVEEALTIPAGERRKKPVKVEGQVSMDEIEDADEE